MKLPFPIELLQLRSATAVYLDIIRDVDQWAEQAADVGRIASPDFAALLDQLRDELRVALRSSEQGTPAGIDRVLAELLGEG